MRIFLYSDIAENDSQRSIFIEFVALIIRSRFYTLLKDENEKLKIELEKRSSNNTIVIETINDGHDIALEKLREENKQLKKEKEHLTTGLHKFTKGHNLQSEIFMNTVMKMDKILVLEEGRVVGFNSHHALMETCPAYQKMVHLQALEQEVKGGE